MKFQSQQESNIVGFPHKLSNEERKVPVEIIAKKLVSKHLEVGQLHPVLCIPIRTRPDPKFFAS